MTMGAGFIGPLDQYRAAVMDIADIEAAYFKQLVYRNVPLETALQMTVSLHETNMQMFRR